MKLSLNRVIKQIMKENKAEKAKDGSMVAFFIPPDVSQELCHSFDDVDGDAVKPEDMHITLGLVNNPDQDNKKIYSALKLLSPSIKNVKFSIDHVSYFPPNKHNDNKYVLYAEPEVERIFDIHDFVLDNLHKVGVDIDNGSFAFKPHITIKYCDVPPPIKDLNFQGHIDAISLATRGKKYSIPLGKHQ